MAASKQHKLLQAGARAPRFRLARLEGGKVTLDELLAGGPVLLAFFKITCPVCQLTFPFLERINSGGMLPIYGISQNQPADTREFKAEFGVTFPILLDEEEEGFPDSNDYGISNVPTMFLVERDGAISRVFEGWNRNEIEWLGDKAGVNPIRGEDNVPAWKSG
jgi:peroxiredoxin